MSRGKRLNFRILSGGQTGVDRAALDAAIEAGIECGGWCPKGRRAEDGVIDEAYPLSETPHRNYGQRTEWNVRDSDATLVLAHGKKPTGGTALTLKTARRLGRPALVVDPGDTDTEAVRQWLTENGVATLNIAGPRESQQPGIYGEAMALLRHLFAGVL